MQLEIKEMLTRFANGNFTKICYTHGGVLLTWDKGTNPLEVAGTKSSKCESRYELLKSLNNSSDFCFSFSSNESINVLIIVTAKDSESITSYLMKASNLECWSDRINGKYNNKTLYQVLGRIRDSFTPTGSINLGLIPTNSESIEIPKWTLHKENYTNQEVQDILEEFKKEMLETTNQLFNRLVDRINK